MQRFLLELENDPIHHHRQRRWLFCCQWPLSDVEIERVPIGMDTPTNFPFRGGRTILRYQVAKSVTNDCGEEDPKSYELVEETQAFDR